MYSDLNGLIAAIGETELIERTDRDGTGAIDTAILAIAQQRADRDIDSYCRNRYPVPFNPVPAEISDRAVDMTRFYLYSDVVPEWVDNRYMAAMAWLRAVSAGAVQLPTYAPAVSENLVSLTAEPRRGWSRC